jgi:hypothetical protein
MKSALVRILNKKITALLQMGMGPSLAEAISLMYTVEMVETYETQLLLDNMDID